MSKKYWLVKSEPEVFSIINLQNQKDQTTYWDGVRNYQARNYLRDEMKIGDSVLFYHSNAEPLAIVGVCDVVKEGYPDFTAFDPKNNHFDPKSKKENPTWYMVDLKLNEIFKNPVTLEQIKSNKKLQDMKLIQRGNRLSVMPITKDEFNEIIRMSK
ncbi:MAG TPA: EVE domain-containing protein [Ignavibacteriaceae bacterium]|nr:EVE domain-containing protein [Ignavibacteriaceae bacterium]